MFAHALEGFLFVVVSGFSFLYFGEAWCKKLCIKYNLGSFTERGHSVVAYAGFLIIIFLGMLIAAR